MSSRTAHPGYARLLADLALDEPVSHDPGHIPLRHRVLIHAREVEELTWEQCGRVLGVTASGALQLYQRVAPHDCCPDPDVPGPCEAPDTLHPGP